MPNEELVKQIQKGINQTDNMKQLYKQNEDYIRKITYRYSYSKEDREDYKMSSIAILQEHDRFTYFVDTALSCVWEGTLYRVNRLSVKKVHYVGKDVIS